MAARRGGRGMSMVEQAILSSFQSPEHSHDQCVRQAVSRAEAVCAVDGKRLTPLRRRVLEIVWSGHGPIGAYEILDRLREENRRAAPPTVYRALEFLIECGLVHRIESLNAFVGCGDPARNHTGQFLICGECGSVGELDDPEIETLLAAKAKTLGFRAHRQTIEIQGVCAGCAEASANA